MKASRLALAWLACGAALGCGSGDEPASTDVVADASAAQAPPQAAAHPENAPPVFSYVRLVPDDFAPGDRVTADVGVSDPDGDTLRLAYRWTLEGQRVGTDTPVVEVPPAAVRDAELQLEVIAVDGRGGRSQFTIRAGATNRAPAVTNIMIEPGYEVRVGEELAASFRGDDPDGDPITFEHAWLVNGREIATTGPRLAAEELARGDVVTLRVFATDGDLESPRVTSEPIHVINTPPMITSSPAGFDENGAIDYHVQVSDPDGDRRLRFRLRKGPPGMTLDWLKGHLYWAPEAQQAGRHAVEIEVDDQNGGVVTQSFAIEVDPEAMPGPAAQAP